MTENFFFAGAKPETPEGFKILELVEYFTEKHTIHLKQFFDATDINFFNIPFRVKLNGYNTLATPVHQTAKIRIPVNETQVKDIYFLGHGTYIAQQFGHKDLYCDRIDHFSILINYSDATADETFPIDMVLEQKQWSDILRTKGSVSIFKAKPIGCVHLYRISVDPDRTIEYIQLNDKHLKGQYVIFAITLQLMTETAARKEEKRTPEFSQKKANGSIEIEVKTSGMLYLDGIRQGRVSEEGTERFCDFEIGSHTLEIHYDDGEKETKKIEIIHNFRLSAIILHLNGCRYLLS